MSTAILRPRSPSSCNNGSSSSNTSSSLPVGPLHHATPKSLNDAEQEARAGSSTIPRNGLDGAPLNPNPSASFGTEKAQTESRGRIWKNSRSLEPSHKEELINSKTEWNTQPMASSLIQMQAPVSLTLDRSSDRSSLNQDEGMKSSSSSSSPWDATETVQPLPQHPQDEDETVQTMHDEESTSDLSTSSLYGDLPFAQEPSSSLPVAPQTSSLPGSSHDREEDEEVAAASVSDSDDGLEDFPTPFFLQDTPSTFASNPTPKESVTSLIPYSPPPIPPTPQVLAKPSTNTVAAHSNTLLSAVGEVIPHKGLVNLGNTCYFNAALQMLMSLNGFVDEIISSYEADEKVLLERSLELESSQESELPFQEEKKEEDRSLPQRVGKQRTKYPLRDALAVFFQSCQADQNSLHTLGNNAVSNPTELKEVIDSLTSQFLGYRQQDAHELVSTLLDLLHDELKKKENTNEDEREEKAEESHENFEVGGDEREEKAEESHENFEVGGTQQNEDKCKESSPGHMDPTNEQSAAKEENNDVCYLQLEDQNFAVEGDLVMRESLQDDDSILDEESKSCVSEKIQTDSLTVQVNHSKQGIETTKSALSDEERMGDDETIVEITKPREEPEGFVIVEKMEDDDDDDEDGEMIESTCSSSSMISVKKARITLSSSPSTLGDSYVHCPSNVPKRPSYSELNVNDIATLLHGDSGDDSVDITTNTTVPIQEVVTPPRRSWASVAGGAGATGENVMPIPSHSIGKLIGGRLPHLPSPITLACHENKSPLPVSSEEKDEEELGAMDIVDSKDDNATVTDSASPLSSIDERKQANDPESTSPLITPVDAYFTTRVRTCITCDSCHYTRSQEESFRYLSIEVGSGDDDIASSHDRTVQEGIRKFFSPQKLELKCEKCFCESATKRTHIIQLPRALLLHLKRFIVDFSPDFSRISYKKNQAAIDFGEELSLRSDDVQYGVLGEFLGKDALFPVSIDEQNSDGTRKGISYKIRSIVNHIGSSASCGHYTADAKKIYKKCENKLRIEKDCELKWTRFNDSYVSRIRDCEAMQGQAQKTAYMLMYELE